MGESGSGVKSCYCCDSDFIVIELIFFMFKIGDAMLDPAARLFIYQGVCMQHFPNATTCYNLRDFPDHEALVQSKSASYIMYYKLLLNLPAVFLGLCCGAWSDRVGRKLPVLMSPLGTIMGVVFLMLSMIVEGQKGFLPLVLIGATVRGLFGKSAVITMALHSYVSDTSEKEERTKRIGKLLSMNFFGYFVGSLTVGAVLEVYSFDVVFCTVVFVECFCVITTVLFMKDSVPPPPEGDAFGVPREENNSKKIPFHYHHVIDSLNVLIKPRDSKGRLHLILFFFTIMAHQICKSGETDTTLLLVEKSPLNWDKSMYGFLLATDYACLGLAVFFLLPVLLKLFNLRDLTLVLVGIFFKILRLFILGFSTHTWMVFLSVVLGCPSAMIISGSKSLISKSVNEDEIGKTFSLLSAGETACNLLGTVIFTNMYTATFRTYPGLTFILDGIFYALIFLILICIANDLQINSQVKLLQNILGNKDKTSPNYGTTDDEYSPLPITEHNKKLDKVPEEDDVDSEYEDVTESSSNY